MSESHDREIIGGHLLVIGGAEDKYNERRILKKFLKLAGKENAEVLIIPVASESWRCEPAGLAGDFAAGRG